MGASDEPIYNVEAHKLATSTARFSVYVDDIRLALEAAYRRGMSAGIEAERARWRSGIELAEDCENADLIEMFGNPWAQHVVRELMNGKTVDQISEDVTPKPGVPKRDTPPAAQPTTPEAGTSCGCDENSPSFGCAAKGDWHARTKHSEAAAVAGPSPSGVGSSADGDRAAPSTGGPGPDRGAPSVGGAETDGKQVKCIHCGVIVEPWAVLCRGCVSNDEAQAKRDALADRIAPMPKVEQPAAPAPADELKKTAENFNSAESVKAPAPLTDAELAKWEHDWADDFPFVRRLLAGYRALRKEVELYDKMHGADIVTAVEERDALQANYEALLSTSHEVEQSLITDRYKAWTERDALQAECERLRGYQSKNRALRDEIGEQFGEIQQLRAEATRRTREVEMLIQLQVKDRAEIERLRKESRDWQAEFCHTDGELEKASAKLDDYDNMRSAIAEAVQTFRELADSCEDEYPRTAEAMRAFVAKHGTGVGAR